MGKFKAAMLLYGGHKLHERHNRKKQEKAIKKQAKRSTDRTRRRGYVIV